MPDLRRLLLASAAVVLLPAITGGQQQASPFRQPPRMPPEITPGNGARPLEPPPRITVDLDNAHMRVVRYRVAPHSFVNLPDVSNGQLIVAMTGLELRTISGAPSLRASEAGTVSLRPGETRWLSPGSWISNLSGRVCEFLLIQPKGN